jgi:hypothetical protein
MIRKSAKFKRPIYFTLCLFSWLLFAHSNPQVLAQTRAVTDKPWQELVSSEGKFRVLLPDAASEMSVPSVVRGDSGGRLYFVKSSVAVYAIITSELPQTSEDPDLVKAALESTSDFLVASGKLRVIGEKNISSPGIQARQFTLDDGAFITTARVYFTKGRLYELIFSRPGLGEASPHALAQFYDGLAVKFFNSFKIGG